MKIRLFFSLFLRSNLLIFLISFSTYAGAVPILQNDSFEINNVPSSPSYLYAGSVTAAPWSFDGGAGISRNDPVVWHGTTNSGEYFAFLQTSSSIAQTFSSDGSYDLIISFDMAERAGGYSPNQIVEIYFDNVLQASINPDENWNTYHLANVMIGTGNHTIEFRGTFTGADASAFLDNVQMITNTVTVPEPNFLALICIGLLSFYSVRSPRSSD